MALEPVLPRTRHDDDLGRLIRARFGDEVAERLVDPLVGGINAGSIDGLSIEAATPQLSTTSRSLLRGLARPAAPVGPVFMSPLGGVGALPVALHARLPEVRINAAVSSIERVNNCWAVDGVEVDEVILATPAFATADLLHMISPDAAMGLRSIDYASVVMVTLAYRRVDVRHALDAAGVLIPKSQQRHATACSFGSTKWPHWSAGESVVLRVSLGRLGNDTPLGFDDAEAASVAHREIAPLLNVSGGPIATRVSRWERSFPQYVSGHKARVAAIRAALPPGITVAGAGYDGLGVPACIRQGQEAVRSTATRSRS